MAPLVHFAGGMSVLYYFLQYKAHSKLLSAAQIDCVLVVVVVRLMLTLIILECERLAKYH